MTSSILTVDALFCLPLHLTTRCAGQPYCRSNVSDLCETRKLEPKLFLGKMANVTIFLFSIRFLRKCDTRLHKRLCSTIQYNNVYIYISNGSKTKNAGSSYLQLEELVNTTAFAIPGLVAKADNADQPETFAIVQGYCCIQKFGTKPTVTGCLFFFSSINHVADNCMKYNKVRRSPVHLRC